MPLPTLLKTWEFITNVPAGGDTAITTYQSQALAIKNTLTNTVTHIFNRGNIQLVSGSTYRINPGDTTFDPADIGSVVGFIIKIRGMTSAANNGDYTVTGQVDVGGGVYVLEYTNGAAVAEAIVGSVNAIGTDFTFPLELVHSANYPLSSSPSGVGDGVDRIETLGHWNHSSNLQSYFVLRNTVTGTEFLLQNGNSTTADDNRGVVRVAMAPNVFDAPAYNGSIPTGPSRKIQGGTAPGHVTFIDSFNNSWFILNLVADARFHCMISSDGEQLRAFWTYDGLDRMFMLDGFVRNANAAWALDPDTPTVATLSFPGNATGERATFAIMNDLERVALSRLPPPSPGILPKYNAVGHLTSEGYGSAALGENIIVPNELSGEWPLAPVGIAVNTPQYRGRMGMLPDIWWSSTALSAGHTFPNSTSRDFIQVGDLVLPWNGDVPEFM